MGSNSRHVVQVYVGSLSNLYEALSVEASKQTTAEEIIECLVEKLSLDCMEGYELAEVVSTAGGAEFCKERRLGKQENPVAVQVLWPKHLNSSEKGHNPEFQAPEYRFYLRQRELDCSKGTSWPDGTDPQLIRDYFLRFLYQPKDKEYADLCQLPDLNETTLLENLRSRFDNGYIYTYVGSILIAVNPFKFYPIYNPKYVKLYQNRRLGELPPHIFAIADAAYHTMLNERTNQCVVISGESGSGKTESTNLLLHHLTALSQKGSHGSGVEQTILSAGPVLEAFGNAKTAHNNNSSRFGKFIQVNYRENGMVHGAMVQKYLLEKSRIVSHARNERNYHVFYYLLAGASIAEREYYKLEEPKDYRYLNQSSSYVMEGVDEAYEFLRLKQSMEMVGFSAEKQRRLFSVLSAVLHLGNIEFVKKKTYHHHEAVSIKNPELVSLISSLLKVKEETLTTALTSKKAKACGETLIINYKLPEAIATRDALAKCLYGALFDWIVMQVNHALLSKKDAQEHQGNAIGVLDIFGFEDFGQQNSFEQFCINFANEHLQYYFNQHVFRYEQEEYRREGIRWTNIEFIDNTGCLNLVGGRPSGLFCLLDDQCSFPGATNETLLQKYENQHKESEWYEIPQKKENAFFIKHYAGKVKYQIKDFREKNLDLMRTDIVSVLKNSSMSFVRELVGVDPVAVFRWAIVRAFFRAYHAFQLAGKVYRNREGGADRGLKKTVAFQNKKQVSNENLHSYTSHKILRRQTPPKKVDPIVTEKAACFEDGVPSSPLHGLENLLCSTEAKVIHRANKILMKNRSFKPKVRNDKTLKNLQSVKTLAGRTQSIGPSRTTRKQTSTVTAQFQYSLSQLMVTLSQASPFFVRCIKSNGEKVSNLFDDELVQRQLRYTGMLETVRIRQAGYNVRLTFEEFIQNYRILLPKGLLSSRRDITEFLSQMDLNKDNYQMGKAKVFLRESEKLKLDEHLHQAILARIVRIQRWMRSTLERRSFLNLRNAVTTIQSCVRGFLARRTFQQLKMQMFAAAVCVQKFWRGYTVRRRLDKLKKGVVFVQRMSRGHSARVQFTELMEKRQNESRVSIESRSVGSQSPHSDEAFVSKENSQDDFHSERIRTIYKRQFSKDSEESSGIQDDSEMESTETSGPSSSKVHVQLSSGSMSSLSSVSPTSLPYSDTAHYESSNESSKLSTVSTSKSSWHHEMSQVTERVRHVDSSVNGKHKWNYRTSELVKPSFTLHEEDSTKTNVTIKRSRSAKASLQELNCDITEESITTTSKRKDVQSCIKTPVKMIKDKSPDEVKSPDASSSFNKSGAFYKAKKHFRTFIGGSKKEKRGTVTDESDESGCEEVSLSLSESLHDIPFSGMNGSSVHRRDSEESVVNTHTFKTSTSFYKWEDCAYCQKSMSFFNQGYKCSVCKLMFHPKCSQQSHRLSCCYTTEFRTPRAPRKRKPSKGSDMKRTGKWNLTRTTEFTDSKDKIISDVSELQRMDTFFLKKISEMNEIFGRRDTIVDVIFKRALKEFKANLISTYSVASLDGEICVRYKDLIDNFEQIMESVCKQENTSASFPSTMGLNAFRGFLDQFMNSLRAEEKPKTKVKKEKRKKVEQAVEYLEHKFLPVVVNIPTACESCSSFMWMMEKGLVCQACKLTCHKKCCCKITYSCKERHRPSIQEGNNKVFGVSLQNLVTEDIKIPIVAERLITAIEMKGLYTEGIYRKSGSSTKVRALKEALEEDWEQVDFDLYAIHVLTTTLKSFFREMPQPLLTFECYDSFLRATDLSDFNEKIQTLYSVMDSLPKHNFDLLERLVFHLARVAQHESSNRMSPNALSIVFGPCILRTNKCMQAQDSLNDIAKQTTCVEYIIKEQLKKLKVTLADIDTLDTAYHTASNRLSSLRSSKVEGKSHMNVAASEDEEENILTQHIETLQHEKAHLTTVLPALELKRASSDDDMLSTDVDSNAGSVDDISGYEEYAITFDLPVSPPAFLKHLTKQRASVPHRRLPSKFSRAYQSVQFGDNEQHSHSESHGYFPYQDDSIISMYHQPIISMYEDDAIMV